MAATSPVRLTVSVVAFGALTIAGIAAIAAQRAQSTSSSPPPNSAPRNTVYSIVFTPSLAPIAQCPQYAGPRGPGVGPFSMNISVQTNGSFSDLVSLATPVATLAGLVTSNSVTGTFSCNGGGGPAGGMSASGTAPDFLGTWNWGGQSGSVVIKQAPPP